MSSFANLKRPLQNTGNPVARTDWHAASSASDFGKQACLGRWVMCSIPRANGFAPNWCELAFQMSGGTGDLPAGLIEFVELLHGGSLVIDDIEDGSDSRRGKPTLHRVVGTPLAINTGNWMYFSALEKLHDLPLAPEVANQIMGQTLRTIRRCHEGQALDLAARVVELERGEVYPTAEAISQLKTGGVTALAASLGAAVAGANPIVQKAFHSFGMQLGVGLADAKRFARTESGDSSGRSLRRFAKRPGHLGVGLGQSADV